jgi:hypothetical protein
MLSGPRGARRASSARPRTSAASGRPTPRATASTSSPTGPTPTGPEPRDRHGIAVTYQAVAAGPRHATARARSPTLSSPTSRTTWASTRRGAQAREAFGPRRFSLLLSRHAVPLRQRGDPVGRLRRRRRLRADYAYGYPQALVDGVCRPITFRTYDGDMEWVSDGKRRRADVRRRAAAAEAARRLRTALDADGDWIGHVLRDADARAREVRAGRHPDAGRLVVATDKEHAERDRDGSPA